MFAWTEISIYTNNKLGHKHLITKQDLYNIRTQFSIIHNENDSASVMAWVSEMGTLDYNPVLAYKPQGVDSNHMSNDKFLLVLQTKFQCKVLKEFGFKAVCIYRFNTWYKCIPFHCNYNHGQ